MTSAFPLNVFPMIPLGGHLDPPPAPPGYDTEVRRDAVQGVVTHYRHVPSGAESRLPHAGTATAITTQSGEGGV